MRIITQFFIADPDTKAPNTIKKRLNNMTEWFVVAHLPRNVFAREESFFGYQRVVQVKDCRRIWCIFVVQWLPSAFKPDYLPHHLPNITGVWKEKKLGVVHVMGGIIHWLLMADCVPCLIRQKLGAMAGLKTPATNLDAFSKVNCQTVNFDIF